MCVPGEGQALELTPQAFKRLSEAVWWLCRACFLTDGHRRAGVPRILKIDLSLLSLGFHIALIRGQMAACDDMVISVI